MISKTKVAVQIVLAAALTVPIGRHALGQTTSLAPPEAAANASDATLVPPRLVTFVEATYPAEAKVAGKAARVELELTLDAIGQVNDVVVVSPVGDGFDEAASAAARGFQFVPAQRGGKAIPSKIRYQYVFENTPAAPAAVVATGGTLEGRVLLQGEDDVVFGAHVVLKAPDGNELATTTTGADGAFTFRDLPEGRYQVHVRGQDLVSMNSDEDVTAGDLTSVTYRMNAVAPQVDANTLQFGATATIEAPQREVTKRTLQAEELIRVAGTRGDALRAVEYMPGVSRSPQGNFIIIRGSSPADSDVQFEGAPVFRLYHFGGLTSFVQSRTLEKIDLYPGNFSVRFGRRMGGIIDVGIRDPKSDGFHGMVDVNVIDASILAEGPVGRRGAIAVAAKRSYIDTFFKQLMPKEIGVTAAPVYWDYQVIGSYRLSDKDKFRAMLYGSGDSFKLVLRDPDDGDPAVRGQLSQYSSFHRGQFRWKHQYSDKIEHEITATAGTSSFGLTVGPEVSMDVPGYDAYLRAEWRAQVHERVKLIGGLDLAYNWIDAKYTGPAITQLDGDPDTFGPLTGQGNVSFNREVSVFRPAAYAEAVLLPTDKWQIVPGIRGDHEERLGTWTLDPRLTSRYQLFSATAVKAGAGLFSQPPDFAEALAVVGNPNLKASRSQHYSAGVDQKLGSRLTVTVEGFYKRLNSLVVNSPIPGENLNNDGIGRIYGGEFSARLMPSTRTTGFLSYTASRSQRNDHGQQWRLFNWDQTHVLAMAGSVRLGRGWDLSTTFRYATGNPYTRIKASIYNANLDVYRPLYGEVNGARDPAFHRLDLRVEKSWTVRTGRVAAYLDLQNAYNRQAQEGRAYNYNFRDSTPIPGLPLIPSIGLRGEI